MKTGKGKYFLLAALIIMVIFGITACDTSTGSDESTLNPEVIVSNLDSHSVNIARLSSLDINLKDLESGSLYFETESGTPVPGKVDITSNKLAIERIYTPLEAESLMITAKNESGKVVAQSSVTLEAMDRMKITEAIQISSYFGFFVYEYTGPEDINWAYLSMGHIDGFVWEGQLENLVKHLDDDDTGSFFVDDFQNHYDNWRFYRGAASGEAYELRYDLENFFGDQAIASYWNAALGTEIITGWEAAEADKSQLTALIGEQDQEESDYTADSWAVYSDALEQAEAVYADEGATQEDIDNAIVELEEAIAQLKLLVPEGAEPVADAGQLNNALMNEKPHIVFVDNITQGQNWDDLRLKYDVRIDIGDYVLTLEESDIIFTADAMITGQDSSRIKGATGSEAIYVLGAEATIMGLNNEMIKIEDIDYFDVSSSLTLDNVQFDRGEFDIVEFDVNTGSYLNVVNTVRANNVELTFVGGTGNYNFYDAGVSSFYGTIQGDGTIDHLRDGRLVVKGQNYLFRGLNNNGLLTLDLLVETRIKTDAELEVARFPVDRNVVFANLELMDEVRIYNSNNIIIADNSNLSEIVIRGNDGFENGEFIGAEGLNHSWNRVIVNRNYLRSQPSSTSTTFDNITMKDIKFNIAERSFGQTVNITDHGFRNRVAVQFPAGETLTATGPVYVDYGVVEFGRYLLTDNVGTFKGPGTTVHGDGKVLFSQPYLVEGSNPNWFEFAAKIELESDVKFANLALHTVDYLDDVTVGVYGDLIAYNDNRVYGLFDGSYADAVVEVRRPTKLINLTFRDVDDLIVNRDTRIVDELGETRDTTDVGLDLTHNVNAETFFTIADNTSLIVDNTRIRIRDEVLSLDGHGAIRGVGSDSGTFFSRTGGIVNIVEGSRLALHGDGTPEIDLVFDLKVKAQDASVTELGSVRFTDWLDIDDNADVVFTVIGNKIANFDAGITLGFNAELFIDTAAQDIPTIMAVAPDHIRGTIQGHNKAEIRGDGYLILGDLLKVDNFTLRDSLRWVGIEEDIIITMADVTIEEHWVEFFGTELNLEGYLKLDDFAMLIFEGSDYNEARLLGHNNIVLGDGKVIFASLYQEKKALAQDVTFDLDSDLAFEVLVLGMHEIVGRAVEFKDVTWTPETLVSVPKFDIGDLEGLFENALIVPGSLSNFEAKSYLRLAGTVNNDGITVVWGKKDAANALIGSHNLSKPDNVDYQDGYKVSPIF